MQSCEVRLATHVKAGGRVEAIASKWGIDSGGRFAKNKDGGFGVVTESGRKISMWEAEAYYRDEPDPEMVWALELTQAQHSALMTFLSDYMRQPEAIEESVFVTTDEVTRPSDLLSLVMKVQPKRRGEML
jgi:hypothetical protein